MTFKVEEVERIIRAHGFYVGRSFRTLGKNNFTYAYSKIQSLHIFESITKSSNLFNYTNSAKAFHGFCAATASRPLRG